MQIQLHDSPLKIIDIKIFLNLHQSHALPNYTFLLVQTLFLKNNLYQLLYRILQFYNFYFSHSMHLKNQFKNRNKYIYLTPLLV